MGLEAKIGELDRRYLYVLLIILVATPLLYPVGLPLKISPMTRSMHTFMESLPEGSVILFDIGIGFTQLYDSGIGCLALIKHMYNLNLKWVGFSTGIDGPMVYEYFMEKIGDPTGKTYGEDWVYLGYVAGGESMIAQLAIDIYSIYPNDFYGTPVEEIPLMREVKNHEDIDLIVTTTNLGPTVEAILRHWKSPYDTNCAANVGSGMGPAFIPFYPDQLLSVMIGVSSGSEYELIAGVPGPGLSTSDAMSLATVEVLFFIVLGNIALIMERLKKGGEKIDIN